MIVLFTRGRWSVTYGGAADPVFHVRYRNGREAAPTPIGRPYPSLFALVREQDADKPDAILWTLLEQCREFMRSTDYRVLTEPIRVAA